MAKKGTLEKRVARLAIALKDHRKTFLLYPRHWKSFPKNISLKWNTQCCLKEAEAQSVPRQRGIYALVVHHPNTNFPSNNYLFYVGLVGDKKKKGIINNERSLKARFREYLREEKALGRALVWEMLRQFRGHVYFQFVTIPDKRIRLSQIETALLDALLPPCNEEDFSIEVGKAVKIARAN